MPAVVEQGDIGAAGLTREAKNGLLHGGLIEIGRDERIESRSLQGRSNVGCIIGRIGQRGNVPVGAVSDHQRDALIGLGFQNGQDEQP
ncbi:hypothetical protein ACVWWG_003017 [Bradyrhizobium sp. LB7.2]